MVPQLPVMSWGFLKLRPVYVRRMQRRNFVVFIKGIDLGKSKSEEFKNRD
jgi:hypothetical protein